MRIRKILNIPRGVKKSRAELYSEFFKTPNGIKFFQVSRTSLYFKIKL